MKTDEVKKQTELAEKRQQQQQQLDIKRETEQKALAQQELNAKKIIIAYANGKGYKLNLKGISSFIDHMQKTGNIKNSINTLVYSSDIDAFYTAFDVHDSIVLYRFKNSRLNFNSTIMIEKTKDDIVINDQRLNHNLHLFTGVKEYTTRLGTKRTVPVFQKVSISK